MTNELRPPPEHADKPFHWIATKGHPDGEPMQWDIRVWYMIADADEFTPDGAHGMGWRYIGPCERPLPPPPNTHRVRILVAIDERGANVAWGNSALTDEQLRDMDTGELEGEIVAYHWIEADVAAPERPTETTVEGRVT